MYACAQHPCPGGLFLILAGLTCLVGCSRSSGVTVSGEVIYEGSPVASGYVSLVPADGKGATVGAEIKEGKFTIKEVTPGDKIISVTGGQDIQFPRSSEEMAQMAARGEQLAQSPGIPPNAVGNGQKITITGASSQSIKLELKRPVESPPGRP